jgi:predicted RNA-binding protein YlqC (UPF0109 family)
MPQQELCRVYSLLFRVIRAVAHHPAELKIRMIRTRDGATFNISGHPEDIRNMTDRRGGIARSLAVLLSGVGLRTGKTYRLSIDALPKTVSPDAA